MSSTPEGLTPCPIPQPTIPDQKRDNTERGVGYTAEEGLKLNKPTSSNRVLPLPLQQQPQQVTLPTTSTTTVTTTATSSTPNSTTTATAEYTRLWELIQTQQREIEKLQKSAHTSAAKTPSVLLPVALPPPVPPLPLHPPHFTVHSPVPVSYTHLTLPTICSV